MTYISMALKAVLESLVTIFLACLRHVAVIFFRDAFRIASTVLGAFKLSLFFQRWYLVMNLRVASLMKRKGSRQ